MASHWPSETPMNGHRVEQWEKHIDERTGYYFYYLRETGESVWILPGSEPAAESQPVADLSTKAQELPVVQEERPATMSTDPARAADGYGTSDGVGSVAQPPAAHQTATGPGQRPPPPPRSAEARAAASSSSQGSFSESQDGAGRFGRWRPPPPHRETPAEQSQQREEAVPSQNFSGAGAWQNVGNANAHVAPEVETTVEDDGKSEQEVHHDHQSAEDGSHQQPSEEECKEPDPEGPPLTPLDRELYADLPWHKVPLEELRHRMSDRDLPWSKAQSREDLITILRDCETWEQMSDKQVVQKANCLNVDIWRSDLTGPPAARLAKAIFGDSSGSSASVPDAQSGASKQASQPTEPQRSRENQGQSSPLQSADVEKVSLEELGLRLKAEVSRIHQIPASGDCRLVLGLQPADDIAAAKKARNQLALILHPDKRSPKQEHDAGGKDVCDEAFERVNKAFEKFKASRPKTSINGGINGTHGYSGPGCGFGYGPKEPMRWPSSGVVHAWR